MASPRVVDVLRARPITFPAQLTLPDGYDTGEQLGLDAAEAEAYDDVASWLRFGDDRWSRERADHWVLGVQGHANDDDTVLPLHLSWDEPLGFEFLDRGPIQFRIQADALATGDWSNHPGARRFLLGPRRDSAP